MAEVFIAASSGEEAQARGLAEALATLGYETSAAAPAEEDIAKLANDAKCVIALWSGRGAPPAWMAVLATLALERKKLICAEFRGAAPAPFQTAPRFDLGVRDRAAIKERFAAFVAEIDKHTTAKANTAGIPEAVIRMRAALLRAPRGGPNRQLTTLAAFGAAVAVLFAVGFGAGRLITAVRSGTLFAAAPASAAATPASATPTSAPAPSLDWNALQKMSWEDAARRLTDADGIKTRAMAGDARAQALACLGHLAGVEGFLPSPTAAREFCDASAAQNEPAGLYLSWVLQRASPHAGIDAATAQQRLERAAQAGWTAAQVDYGQVLARNPAVASQAEAGRWWLAAAESGDPRGQFFYGRWLRDSPAGPRDPTAAARFLERAAESGQLDALHMLATLYRDGIGVSRNPERARQLYERAAQSSHTPSMFNLADMLRDGAAPDRARAIALYGQLACMRDERQIQPMAEARLRALHESVACR